MTTLTQDQLAELERLEAAATPGEWRAFVSVISSGYGGIETHDPALSDEGEESVLPTSSAKEDDLLFIAAIRNAAKPLIEMVRQKDEALEIFAAQSVRLADIIADLRRQLAERDALISKAKNLIDDQAEDDGLWFVAETITETQLQKSLRKLSAIIEETDDFGIPLKGPKP